MARVDPELLEAPSATPKYKAAVEGVGHASTKSSSGGTKMRKTQMEGQHGMIIIMIIRGGEVGDK